MRISQPVVGFLTSATHDLVGRHGLSVTGIKLVQKTGIQTVNNSTTLVNDTDLKFAVDATNYYLFLAILYVYTVTTAGFRFAFTMPGGGACHGIMPDDIGPLAAGGLAQWVDLTSGRTYATCTGQSNILLIFGVTAPGSAGDAQLQWAQGTAIASNTQLSQASCILVMRAGS